MLSWRRLSKSCVELPLKKAKTKIFMTNGSLMKVENIVNAPLGTFCNTFDLHLAIIGLEKQFSVFCGSVRFTQPKALIVGLVLDIYL